MLAESIDVAPANPGRLHRRDADEPSSAAAPLLQHPPNPAIRVEARIETEQVHDAVP